jgi:putative ABC transport system ATP-binding protein
VTATPVLALREVRRDYQTGSTSTTALDGISLDVLAGEFVVIVGPSGSGKSTLMNMIGCLDQPTSGSVWIDGADVSHLDDNDLTKLRSRAIGFVFQQFRLLPQTSALENVALPLRYQGVRAKEARERATEALVRLGLGGHLGHDRTELSGGQQQRVAVARATVTSPSILLADEPTGALDSRSGAQVMDLLTDMNAEGRTIILITHDTGIAARAGRRITIHDGLITGDERSAA